VFEGGEGSRSALVLGVSEEQHLQQKHATTDAHVGHARLDRAQAGRRKESVPLPTLAPGEAASAADSLPATTAAVVANNPPFPQCLVPPWLQSVMTDDEVAILGEVMRLQHVQEADLEFFSDDALREAGIVKAISRAKMLRIVRDRFSRVDEPSLEKLKK
jgi:hypothetical protein